MPTLRAGKCFRCGAVVAVLSENGRSVLLNNYGHVHQCKPQKPNVKEQRRKILSQF